VRTYEYGWTARNVRGPTTQHGRFNITWRLGHERQLRTHAARTHRRKRRKGGDQYRKAGWEEKQIQALYAHSEREMTEHYLDGHEHYIEVSDK